MSALVIRLPEEKVPITNSFLVLIAYRQRTGTLAL
jgi:hypothetical protein